VESFGFHRRRQLSRENAMPQAHGTQTDKIPRKQGGSARKFKGWTFLSHITSPQIAVEFISD